LDHPAICSSQGPSEIPVDVRLLIATTHNLGRAVKTGRFRADLYYRLNVFSIYLPPLRERAEDIPALAEHFIEQFRQPGMPEVEGIDAACADLLRHLDWPGNVRQLRNAIQHGMIVARTSLISSDDLPGEIGSGAAAPTPVEIPASMSLEELGDPIIRRTIHYLAAKRSRNYAARNRSRATAILGIGAKTLYNRLRRRTRRTHRLLQRANRSDVSLRQD
jgi:DNA-binding NtrC family response regulator